MAASRFLRSAHDGDPVINANSRESEELVAAGVQETIDPPGDPQAIDAALQRYLGRPKELV